MRRTIVIMLIMLLPFAAEAQRSFTFVELNCENLFDCRHDTLKQDLEFCEGGMRNWNFGRYWRKLNNIGRTILACGNEPAIFLTSPPGDGTSVIDTDWQLPSVVALTEVENDSVLFLLTKRSMLRNAGYEYVMTNSADPRGIDVALLYRSAEFTLDNHYPIRVAMPQGHRPTRDILYARLSPLPSSDTTLTVPPLHIFVVHAPSRSGGKTQSEASRLLVCDKLLQHIDSLRAVAKTEFPDAPSPHIIVAGDFNDYDNDKSIRRISSNDLCHISEGVRGLNGAKGTYRYQGEWGSLDHIFVSQSLLTDSAHAECFIFDAPFLTEPDSKYGGRRPHRTYNGPRYDPNGFSDHLPLVMRFCVNF